MSAAEGTTRVRRIEIPEKTFFKIGEVAKLLGVEPYVLRYWESEFDLLEPEKTKSGQRVYQREDIELLTTIRDLLYEEMFTIAGARRQLDRIREGGLPYSGLASERGDTGESNGPEAADHAKAAYDTALAHQLEAIEQEASMLREHTEGLERQVQELEQLKRQAQEREKLIANLHEEIAGLEQQLDALRNEQVDQVAHVAWEKSGEEERRRGLMQALRREVEVLAKLAHVTV
jgi:DNA-binding transcriptional MerR regulator